MPEATRRRSAGSEASTRRNVREDIYAAALASFERHGVRRTLMEDVAKQAGVGSRTDSRR